MNSEIYLTMKRKVKVKEHVRSYFDRRVFVDLHIVEYRDQYNQEFRKGFECKPNKEVTIPFTGSSSELREAAKQW